VIVLTYFGSFQTTQIASGYFGAWFAFIVSTASLVLVSPSFERGLDKADYSARKPIFFIGLASAVVMGAGIGPCSPPVECVSYNVYSIIVSVVSLMICLILIIRPRAFGENLLRYVAFFLLIWWIFGCAVLTLGAPFQATGNGFFGCYAALLASVYFIHYLHHYEV
jgi:hypothetical protein